MNFYSGQVVVSDWEAIRVSHSLGSLDEALGACASRIFWRILMPKKAI